MDHTCACGEECASEPELLDHIRDMSIQRDPFPHGYIL